MDEKEGQTTDDKRQDNTDFGLQNVEYMTRCSGHGASATRHRIINRKIQEDRTWEREMYY